MTDPEMLPWLRAAITERLELAKRASEGPWSASEVAPAWAGFKPDALTPAAIACVEDADDYTLFVALRFTLPPEQNEANAAHIAANDPQDTITGCEAELAILDACEEATEAGRIPEGATWSDDAAGAVLAERVISLVAAGYRHHPGWLPQWRA